MMVQINETHVGRYAWTVRAGKNSHGTTQIATGQTVEILRVESPLSYLDGPEYNEVFVRSTGSGVTCPMQARDLVLFDECPEVTWRELKEALRPLKAFAGQDEIALGAAADAVLELVARKAMVAGR
ncbi:MAG TPA: hypothetical protein VGL05_19665 [Kribbella sp.]